MEIKKDKNNEDKNKTTMTISVTFIPRSFAVQTQKVPWSWELKLIF